MPRITGGFPYLAALLALLLAAAAGCTAPGSPPGSPPASATASPAIATPVATETPAPAATTPVVAMPRTPSPVVNTTVATTVPTPSPTPTQISDATVSARIVDARNRLEMFIDSNVADTEIVHPNGVQNCEVKKSKELGYLIDLTTGESTFVKGDYWSIDATLFSDRMSRDRRYIVIHTHPRMWVTCGGYGVISLNTFSIGDLEAVANMTERGYHVDRLIAIADMDYRIWPRRDDGWRSEGEIRDAVARVESRTGRTFSYYDPVLDHEFYDVDNLMPYLADELDYHYTVNNNIIA